MQDNEQLECDCEPEEFVPLFPTQIFDGTEECDNPECDDFVEPQAAIFLTAHQIDALRSIAEDGLEYQLALPDEPTIAVFMTLALIEYLTDLADIVSGKSLEERIEELGAMAEGFHEMDDEELEELAWLDDAA